MKTVVLMVKKIIKVGLLVIIVLSMLASCLPSEDLLPGSSMFDEVEETAIEGTDTEASQKVQETVINVFIDKSIPFKIWVTINKVLRQSFHHFNDISYRIVFNKDEADIFFDLNQFSSEDQKLEEPYYYTPVISFFSMIEEITFKDLEDIWKGSKNTVLDISGNEIPVILIVLEKDVPALRKILGTESPENLEFVDTYDLYSSLTYDESTIGIIPFDLIRPELKVLTLDDMSVLDSDLDGKEYALALGIDITYRDSFIDAELIEKIEEEFYSDIFTNRREEDLVSIIMTGVTAMTRQVASRMDANGVLYPAEKISGILLDADITHISNEVPFVEDCYAAKPNTMVFCSKPEYMELLKSIDTDIIELTGNHIIDYGREWFEYTIDMYETEEIQYFGGGKNLEDALTPAFFDINGYKFAFIGANSFGPASSWAAEDSSGSAPINTLDDKSKEEDMQKYEEIIRKLTSNDFNVIFTFQYLETYNYSPTREQVEDFERLSEAGAVIVSGSQAHQPQGIEIREDGFINYGLGNLFFGQALGLPVKQGIIAKHIFYRGDYINTLLITTFIEDFSQPRPTEGQERAELLELIFNSSIRETAQE
jgi:poly-gamma-glutamate synthesis protein (capsule biosynthesis protein)